MKELLHELLILLGMFAVMFGGRWLMERRLKPPDDSDAYTLSDDQGHAIKFLVKKTGLD